MSNLNEKDIGIATIERVQAVIHAYQLNKLHPNVYLRFQYAMAAFYSIQNKRQEAIEALTNYVEDGIYFIKLSKNTRDFSHECSCLIFRTMI